jgi:hypothetical protein
MDLSKVPMQVLFHPSQSIRDPSLRHLLKIKDLILTLDRGFQILIEIIGQGFFFFPFFSPPNSWVKEPGQRTGPILTVL